MAMLFVDRPLDSVEYFCRKRDTMEDRATSIQNVTQQLRIVFRAIQAHSKYIEKQFGLSSAKLWMLHTLHSTPGIKVSKLANALAIHPSTCSNMLDKLEEKGFVYRQRSRTDQRAVHLTLTEKGHNVLQKAPQPAQGELSAALERLSDHNISLLETALQELVGELNTKNTTMGLRPIPDE